MSKHFNNTIWAFFCGQGCCCFSSKSLKTVRLLVECRFQHIHSISLLTNTTVRAGESRRASTSEPVHAINTDTAIVTVQISLQASQCTLATALHKSTQNQRESLTEKREKLSQNSPRLWIAVINVYQKKTQTLLDSRVIQLQLWFLWESPYSQYMQAPPILLCRCR